MTRVNALEAGDPAEIGSYELLGRLGVGGMGEVFLGRGPDGGLAAIKAARTELAGDLEFRRRFAREVDAARKVDGRFTAAVLGADPRARRPWLATEYIPGVSVTEAVASRGPLPEPSLRALTAGIAAALAAIHAAGLTHRDLKPSNVLLADDGPRVIDFGIARSVAHSQITRTGQVPGTPGYMAPEQLRGSEIGSFTDVYALGATLVYAATGEGPFGHGDVFAMIYRTMEQEANVEGVPGATLRRAVARCLAKDPEARPTVAELQAEFSVPATLRTGEPWLPSGVTALVEQRGADGDGEGGLGARGGGDGIGADGIDADGAGVGGVGVDGTGVGGAGAEVPPSGSSGTDVPSSAELAAPPAGPAAGAEPEPATPHGQFGTTTVVPEERPRTGVSRRGLLRFSAAGVAAAAAGGVYVALRGTGDDGGSPQGRGRGDGTGTGSGSDADPLGVTGKGALDLALFNGGYGADYLDDAIGLFKKAHPKVEVNPRATQKIRSLVQPRLGSGNPPDLVDNEGTDPLSVIDLVKKGQLADLTPLLNAPALGSPGKTVRDTVLPQAVEAGRIRVGGKEVYALNYLLTVYGFWYSRKALRDLGTAYPRTWDDLLALCAVAKDQGMAGLTYPGKYPYYLWFAVAASIAKRGGRDVLAALVENRPRAWRQTAVRETFEAYYELALKGHVLAGSGGLDHIGAQAEWVKGRALLIPNGSWVEAEAAPKENFDLAVGPPPSLGADDALPFGTLAVAAGNPFLVPKEAENPEGAMELLRFMLGKEGAARFAKKHGALPCVRDSRGWDLPPGLESARAAYGKAGDNAVQWGGFGEDLKDVSGVALGDMMAKRATPAEVVDRMQSAADEA
ncbi:N-acetylglucosamine/diacetylchitobiose ABC transporter substrate-binding protein [Streptomyces sp. NPDC059009]|uniref:N-acetylglucosamine/diacetylchitobiose ABC transporter substrate-binding protein n=1 Tax=Streptomyces sp. NPDC059009 TaxID=3346694 RepID=UPI00367B01DF